jgi:CRISPR/Cas system CSM-associated protein Csm3 (group 7 of RAMP superfamily)
MARRIHSRYKITGTLIAMSPIHIGGLGGNADTDLALAVNGQQECYIPGTGLAGAFRNWMEIIDSDATNYLWGSTESSSDQDHASFILIEDAVIKKENMIAEIRDNVAIDRLWGTAVDRMKFDRMILPRGVEIPLEILLERDTNLSEEEWRNYQSRFTQLLSALQNGQVSLGAAKTRGLGRVKLNSLIVKEEILNNYQGILNILGGKSEQVDWTDFLGENNLNALGKLEIAIQWKPTSPVMVKAEYDGIAVDILPLVSGFHGGRTFVLPGSSIKGALRTQSERIMRTLLQKDAPRIDQPSSQDFNNQIALTLIETIFGSPAKLDNNTQLGYLGALSVDDCFAKIPLKDWSQVENATQEKDLREALDTNGLNGTQQAFHVAIDRWTGGAADSFLYTVLEPMGFNWYPINLSLDLYRLNRTDQEDEYLPSIALLFLLFRDLMNQRIPLGFGTNRGMGAIEIKEITFKAWGDVQSLESLTLTTTKLTNPNLSDIPRDLLTQLNTSWQTFLGGLPNV